MQCFACLLACMSAAASRGQAPPQERVSKTLLVGNPSPDMTYPTYCYYLFLSYLYTRHTPSPMDVCSTQPRTLTGVRPPAL